MMGSRENPHSGSGGKTRAGELFDDWPDRYDAWFITPVGRLIKEYETELLLEMLAPQPGERILDVGCGTGVFTEAVFTAAATAIVGLDISLPMLDRAVVKTAAHRFAAVAGDMRRLPFAAASFDRVYSMTALEFVEEAPAAVAELDRVCRRGGVVVLTTLNSLGPWAERRRQKAAEGHSLFSGMIFRSPQELARMVPGAATIKTAIHFNKEDTPEVARRRESTGRLAASETGAFVALAWRKE
jgi:ubiquinone/menaquinone biosynthesis C-methylase UbiE